jgi:hypothetical protein
MMYAVTVEILNAVFFLSEPPGEGPWSVEEGILLDIPSNFGSWPEGSERPETILCTSTSDPKYYTLFKYRKDIDPEEFRPTGRNFGGIFCKPSWERFAKTLLASMPFLEIGDDEPLGATEAAISMIKREG